MMVVSAGGACGRAGLRWWARLRGHLDILRLMTRGLTRSRRVLSLCRISRVASVMAAARCSGGKRRLVGDLAAHYGWGADERGPVRVQVDGLGAAVDQDPDGVVDEQVGVDLLDDHLEIGRASCRERVEISVVAVS